MVAPRPLRTTFLQKLYWFLGFQISKTPINIYFVWGGEGLVHALLPRLPTQHHHNFNPPKTKNIKNNTICLCVLLRFGAPQTNKTIYLYVFLRFAIQKHT